MHTLKTQLFVSLRTGEIIALAFSSGRKHDFQLSKDSCIHFAKRFRILSERYRNRRKRFALRFSLIAGICNFDRLA